MLSTVVLLIIFILNSFQNYYDIIINKKLKITTFIINNICENVKSFLSLFNLFFGLYLMHHLLTPTF